MLTCMHTYSKKGGGVRGEKGGRDTNTYTRTWRQHIFKAPQHVWHCSPNTQNDQQSMPTRAAAAGAARGTQTVLARFSPRCLARAHADTHIHAPSPPHSLTHSRAGQALKGLDLVFDKPLLVVGGYCKVHLCGKVQKQPVLGQEEWYCCIAYCGVRGAALRSFHSRLASRGALNQMADLALKPSDDAAGRRVGVDSEACARAGVCGAGKGARSAQSGGGLRVNVAGSMVLAKTKTEGRGGRGIGVDLPMQCAWCGSHRDGYGSFRCAAALSICTGEVTLSHTQAAPGVNQTPVSPRPYETV